MGSESLPEASGEALKGWRKSWLAIRWRTGVWGGKSIRPGTGGGVVCTCWDIRSVNFFLLHQDLYLTIKDGGASESKA